MQGSGGGPFAANMADHGWNVKPIVEPFWGKCKTWKASWIDWRIRTSADCRPKQSNIFFYPAHWRRTVLWGVSKSSVAMPLSLPFCHFYYYFIQWFSELWLKYGGFPKSGIPNSWMVYNGKSFQNDSKLKDFIHIVTGVDSARLTVLGVKEMSRLAARELSDWLYWFQLRSGDFKRFWWISMDFIWKRHLNYMMAISGSFHVQTLCKKSSRRMDPIFGRSDHLRPLGKIWTSFKGWENLLEEEYGNRSVGKRENVFLGTWCFRMMGTWWWLRFFKPWHGMR